MSIQEQIDKILKNVIYGCDGVNKECHRCMYNAGPYKENKVTCVKGYN